ncbi:MAG: hypothetical protein BWX70_03250 [Verrucomicrobia bacterium ADurb.Bin070]|nr:MAG: hypothetical protein BWX70_03250 [Verrucomicrobia bacterium ADurb.Bin070]
MPGDLVQHGLPETAAHRLGAQHEQVEFTGLPRRQQQREKAAFEEVFELILEIADRRVGIDREPLFRQQAVHVEKREIVRAPEPLRQLLDEAVALVGPEGERIRGVRAARLRLLVGKVVEQRHIKIVVARHVERILPAHAALQDQAGQRGRKVRPADKIRAMSGCHAIKIAFDPQSLRHAAERAGHGFGRAVFEQDIHVLLAAARRALAHVAVAAQHRIGKTVRLKPTEKMRRIS